MALLFLLLYKRRSATYQLNSCGASVCCVLAGWLLLLVLLDEAKRASGWRSRAERRMSTDMVVVVVRWAS